MENSCKEVVSEGTTCLAGRVDFLSQEGSILKFKTFQSQDNTSTAISVCYELETCLYPVHPFNPIFGLTHLPRTNSAVGTDG